MPEARFGFEVTGGVPVVVTPQEIDITNAAAMRTVLLEASARGHGTLVVDMSSTQFCDSTGLHVLVRAHKRARAEGGELLLVLPSTTALRAFAITGIDRMIPCFSRLEDALAHAPAVRPADGSPALAGSEPAESPSRSVNLAGASPQVAP